MSVRSLAVFVILPIAAFCTAAIAAEPHLSSVVSPPASSTAAEPDRLPAAVTTHHSLALPDRTLAFSATAGAIRLRDDKNAVQAEVAYVAYQRDGADKAVRPVTFVFNGGPGMASAWLQLGAIGPWRIALGGDTAAPSASPAPVPNAETWLDFTDLVFIDPPGTGYSRIVASGSDARRHFWSVIGDVEAMAVVIRRWLDHNDRSLSPKYLVGESYGGLRVPRLARELTSEQGVGIRGMVLISPLLDAHTESGVTDPFGWVDRLPSEVAAARALKGPVSRADVADAEDYAAGDYIVDLLRGERDKMAIDRVTARVAALTGLDPAVVRRYDGRLDTDIFVRELHAAQRRVGSMYDATVSEPNPFPHRPFGWYPDPVLDALKPPVSSAMVELYSAQLNWRPKRLFELANDAVFRDWNWGNGMGRPEAVSALQAALALDPQLRVLIVHGLFDLRTPYFTSARILHALPDIGAPDRIRLEVYAGGHMFYADDASRVAFRRDAMTVFQP